MKLGLARWQEDNFQIALLSFDQRGSVDVYLALIASGVLHLEWTATLQLNSIVIDSAGSQVVVTKAGAGIIDFEEFNWLSGSIFDRRFNVVGVAPGDYQQCRPNEHGDCDSTFPALKHHP